MKLKRPVTRVTNNGTGAQQTRLHLTRGNPSRKTILQRVTDSELWAKLWPYESLNSLISLHPAGLANRRAQSGIENSWESGDPISDSMPESPCLKREGTLEKARGRAFTFYSMHLVFVLITMGKYSFYNTNTHTVKIQVKQTVAHSISGSFGAASGKPLWRDPRGHGLHYPVL